MTAVETTGVNSGPDVQKRLTSFVERVERLMGEIDDIKQSTKPLQEDIKEVVAEAKGNGFDPKMIRRAAKKLFELKRADKDDYAENAELWRLYWGSVRKVLGIVDAEVGGDE